MKIMCPYCGEELSSTKHLGTWLYYCENPKCNGECWIGNITMWERLVELKEEKDKKWRE